MELVNIFMGMGIITTILGGVAWYNKKNEVANDAALTAGGFFRPCYDWNVVFLMGHISCPIFFF